MIVGFFRRVIEAKVAMVFGATVVVLALAFSWFRLVVATRETHAHIQRVANRDLEWGPVIKDMGGLSSRLALLEKYMIWQDADSAKILAKEEEILKRQDELCGMIQGKKLGEMQSGTDKYNYLKRWHSDENFQEFQASTR